MATEGWKPPISPRREATYRRPYESDDLATSSAPAVAPPSRSDDEQDNGKMKARKATTAVPYVGMGSSCPQSTTWLMRSRWIVLAASACCLVIYWICFQHDNQYQPKAVMVAPVPPPSPASPVTPAAKSLDALMSHARRVPYATSEATAATYAAVAATREPIVWAHSHSFAHQWRARSRWSRDASALGAVVPWVMARLDERGDGEFVLTAPQRGGSSALLHAGPPWEPLQTSTRNVSVAEILSDGAAAQRFYYSGSLHHDAATAHWHADALTADLAPLEPLALLDVPPLLPDDPIQPPAQAGASARPINRTSMRLWLTSGGVLARTHYDKSHNVLCVLHGSKQIVLWPPAELPSLHLYPAVHAAHRQSQVSSLRHATLHAALDARTTDTVHIDTSPTLSLPGVVGDFHLLDAAALLGRGDARSAELTEGSCMYIPPYWAHLVYSPSASVSLAAFSTSWEQARWARSGWMAAPLGRFQSGGLCTKARGAALLVAAFVHSCAPLLVADGRINGRTPRGFLATLYAARYAPLYGVLHDDAPLGAAVGEHSSSASLAACLAASADHPLPPDAPERDAALRGRVRAFGARMAALLTDADPAAGGRRYERGVALELAADYVEEIAGWACGATGAWRLLRLLAQTEETDVGHVVVVERRP